MPAGGVLAPEVCVPHKNFSLDGTQHKQDQSHRRELGEYAEGHAKASRQFSRSEEQGKALAYANVLASFTRIFQVIPAAGDEYDPDHEPQQEEPHVREFSELGKHAETFAECTCYHLKRS